MPRHWIIDGNNLLFAIRAHGPAGEIGREAMLRVIERWAQQTQDLVTLILDGPSPAGGLGKQFSSARIHVQFSAGRTADDLIVDLIHRASDPGHLRVVTADGAIVHEARHRRCIDVPPADFVQILFPPIPRGDGAPVAGEKPAAATEDVDQVLRMMDAEDLELMDDRDLFGSA